MVADHSFKRTAATGCGNVMLRLSAAARPSGLLKLTILLASILTGSCSLAAFNQPPRVGSATVSLALMPDGKPAIYVHSVQSKHRIFRQELEQEERRTLAWLRLAPGSYVLEIDCERPHASAVLHGGFDFEISVQADTRYTMDCAPSKDPKYGYYDNKFSLVKQP